ncbi:hypothetical protein ACQ4PT_062110 [Festuca glaucescens]
MAPGRPPSMGRLKIEIRPIESEEARQVCFSKRRRGLFNKVSELSIMCGVEAAALVFSPGGRAFSFGDPSADSVIDRFMSSSSSEELAEAAADDGAGEPNHLALAPELDREHGELRAKLAASMARMEAAKESFAKARAEGSQAAAWLDLVSQMGEEDLVAYEAALYKARAHVAAEALLFGRPMHGGGGGEFELGGTSASGGMEMTQQQMMMMLDMPPPTEFDAGKETMQQQQMMMMAMPPTMWFAQTEMMQKQQMMMSAMQPTMGLVGTEVMPQQQPQKQQMMELPPLPPSIGTGFDTRPELMLQQQKMMMMAMPPTMGFPGAETMPQQQPQKQQMTKLPPLPPQVGFDAGTEMMQQQQMMMAMPPLLGFSTGMETVHQGFWPHGFPQ